MIFNLKTPTQKTRAMLSGGIIRKKAARPIPLETDAPKGTGIHLMHHYTKKQGGIYYAYCGFCA